MEYFRIKNWNRYQHRDATRNGHMPWVKLYTNILRDEKMMQMTAYQFAIWVQLIALAGEKCNRLPLDQRTLRALMLPDRARKKLKLQFLWDLDLIELWSCQPEASLDKDKDKDSKTKTFARGARQPKSDYVNLKIGSEVKRTGWVNPAQERLRNNMEVAKRAMERSSNEPTK